MLTVPGRTRLHHGGEITDLAIGWSLSGRAGLPVVLALGGISATRKVFDPRDPREGWWREIVGAGRALDTDQVAVLGMDYVGGRGASTGPGSPAADGGSFPRGSSYDQADAALRVVDARGIERLAGIVGASYGGMVGVAFGERYPQRVERLVVISAADVPHPMSTAWRSVQRNIARLGLTAGRPVEALELSRALAMSTYRSPEEFVARFRGPPRQESGRYVFPVEDYPTAAITRHATGPSASSACRNPSICIRSMPRGSPSAPRSSPCARTSSCRWQTCVR